MPEIKRPVSDANARPGRGPGNEILLSPPSRWLFLTLPVATALFMAGCLLAPALAIADSDRLEIRAEQSIAGIPGHSKRHLKNVVIDQGHLHVEADEVTEYLDNGVTTRVVARGDPAIIRHRIAGAATSSSAEAEEFEYLVKQKTILLKNFVITHGNGVVQKGKRAKFVLE